MPHQLHYQEYAPHPALRRYIVCYRVLQTATPVFVAQRVQVFPSGCVDLFFHFTNTSRVDDTLVSQIAAPAQQLFVAVLHGPVDVVGVRFRPATAHLFLHTPIHQFVCHHAGIADVWGAAGTRVEARMQVAQTTAERIAMLDQMLLDRLPSHHTVDPDVMQAVALIEQCYGALTIGEIARTIYLSRRQLERKFSQHVGLTPKQFARVVRLRHVIAWLEQQHPHQSLASISAQSGFFDQAHFIHEFKRSTGLTPSAYLHTHQDGAILQFNAPRL